MAEQWQELTVDQKLDELHSDVCQRLITAFW